MEERPSSNEQTSITSIQIQNLNIRGFVKKSSNVANYLGIPYARIPARFRQAVPIESGKESGTLDATKFGPSCPQVGDPVRGLRQHLYVGTGNHVPAALAPTFVDEFQCLTLNIWMPAGTASNANLPVVVWLHGGGWNVGDGNAEFDGNFLVQRSVAVGKPVVYVALNYRLGYYGWLASRELKDEALRNGEVGFANQGLYDQRLGLHWVQKNIHFFGGDASQVTLAGESAGAWCALAHLRSNVPVCQRAWIMSSPALTLKSTTDAQDTFDRLVGKAGVSASAPASVKLAVLRDLTTQQLEQYLEAPINLPVFDSEWFVNLDPSRPIEHVDQFHSWVQSVAIGQLKEEAAMLMPIWSALKPEQLIEIAKSAIPDSNLASDILQAYGITPSAGPKLLGNFIEFFSDSIYGSVIPGIANRTSPPVFVYRFDQKDAYEQSFFHGWAFHSLDNVFFTCFPAVSSADAPASMRSSSEKYSRALFDFIHGSQPWEAFSTSQKVMAFDGDKTGLIDVPNSWMRFSSTKQYEELYRRGGEKMLAYVMQISAQLESRRQESVAS